MKKTLLISIASIVLHFGATNALLGCNCGCGGDHGGDDSDNDRSAFSYSAQNIN